MKKRWTGIGVQWGNNCSKNHLLLNVNKIKELVGHFKRTTTVTRPITILGEEVGIVEDYEYLDVCLNDRLDWSINTNAVNKMEMSRLFPEETQILQCVFYQSGVGSAIYFA